MIAYILARKNEIDTVGSQENISQDIDESPNYDAMTAYIGNSNIESDKQIVKAEHIFTYATPDILPDPEHKQVSVTVLGEEYHGDYTRKHVLGY
jgi:hypothetical protein